MSLFQARDWWNASIDCDEEFGYGSLCVANIDNEPSGAAKIVTGSYHGTLRIYYPHQRDYKIEDLMLEQNLEQPILQLLCGRFQPMSTQNALAVLHPRSVTVYQVNSEETDGSYYKLIKLYSHRLGVAGLHFTAFNMCHGPFGGAFRKDFLCVQSMDGQLSFFEQDHSAFTRQLPNCMLPGPIAYCEKTDSIITASSELRVESYKYQMLAAASSARPTAESTSRGAAAASGGPARRKGGIGAGKVIKVDWFVNVGERVTEIQVMQYSRSLSATQVDIFVLGEHTMFCLKESGGVRMQKRLDYNPACIATYEKGRDDAGGRDNLMIAAHSSQLMVYRDVKLIWAAVLQNVPVGIAVAEFAGLRGLLVSLEEGGTVRITYMGTDPPTSSVSAADAKELNYEEMDEEHRRLLTQVKESHSEHRPEPEDRVLLRAQVPTVLDSPEESESKRSISAAPTGPTQLTVRLFVSYTGRDEISDVNVSLCVPDTVMARESSFLLPTLAGGRTPQIIPLVFTANPAVMPNNLTVRVAAAYITNTGEPRTAQITLQLPLCLTCRLIAPLKSNTFKFTLDTNKMPPQLPVLFDDMFSQPGLTEDAIQRITASSANVLTFQYFNGEDATILVSKSAGRYRVQSGNLQALWMVSSDLVRRLKDYYAGAEGKEHDAERDEPFQIAYQEPLPLADFFSCIDEHFACRKALADVNERLNDRAHQFRLIQKRLLVRFKERNPSPLANLDMLLHGTYNQLIELGGEVERCQAALEASANNLSCATDLLLMLMRYRFDLDDDNFDVLQAHLSPLVDDNSEQGWEECTDAAMTHLLRTTLAKSAKDTAAVPQPLTVPSDTSKLKKHITIVCDRLTKGARLYRPRRSKK